jgi:hypothetical protein
MGTSSERREIRIEVVSTGDSTLKNLKQQFKELNQNTLSASNSLNTMRSSLFGLAATLGIGFSVQSFMHMADAMQELETRTRLMRDSQADAVGIIEKVHEAANRVRIPIAHFSEQFERLTISTSDMKMSIDEVLLSTELLSHTFRLSAANAIQTTTGMNILNRSFETGVLKGRELRSILVSNEYLFKLLKEQMHLNADGFKKMLVEGIPVTTLLATLRDRMGDIRKNAEEMAGTFSGTMAIAMNDITTKMAELNTEFHISNHFNTSVKFMLKHLPELGVAISLLALTKIPLLVTAIKQVSIALATFMYHNPIVAWFGLMAIAVNGLINNWDNLMLAFQSYGEAFKVVANTLGGVAAGIVEAFGWLTGNLKLEAIAKTIRVDFANSASVAADKFKDLRKQVTATSDALEVMKKPIDLGVIVPSHADKPKAYDKAKDIEDTRIKIGELNKEFASGGKDVLAYNKLLFDNEKHLLDIRRTSGTISLNKYRDDLAKLNKEGNARAFEYHAISLHTFLKAVEKADLTKLRNELHSGTISIGKFHEGVLELDKRELARIFDEGTISLEEFTKKSKELNIRALEEKFRDGRMEVRKYHQEMLALGSDFKVGSAIYVGIDNYIVSSGTLAQNIAKNITMVFNTLETVLFNFTKTGIFKFHEFTQAILDDLMKIIIRAQ